MAVITVAKIQHRRGIKADLPTDLYEGELGFCLDTRELYIGNSVAEGGNTQILTNNTHTVKITPYEFVSDTSVVSQTGASMNEPVVRTLQKQIDDYWVNVKAYGAQGDGITDDTDAINRAIQDLYTKTLTTSENAYQARKAVWFPSGQYLTTKQLKVYPYVRLVGEHAETTVISMTATGAEDSVVTAVDSLGQMTTNIGNNGATVPQYIHVSGLTLETTGNENVILLQRANHVKFEDCMFRGNWSVGESIPSPAPIAVVIETLGSAIASEHFEFVNCRFQQIPWAFNCEEEVSYITFDRCEFTNLHLGIRGNNAVDETGPVYVSASNCIFDTIESFGIQWLSSQSGAGPGIATNACRFVNVGYVLPDYCVIWGINSNNCSSMGDVFDLVSSAGLVNNQGSDNLIVDAQYNNITNIVPLVNVTTTLYNVTISDTVIVAQPTTAGGAITINLPNPATNGQMITIKDGQGGASTYNINLNPTINNYIESGSIGAAYIMNTDWQSVSLVYSSSLSKWLIV